MAPSALPPVGTDHLVLGVLNLVLNATTAIVIAWLWRHPPGGR